MTILIVPLSGFATGQSGDILIYKGDTLIFFSNPLEDYFETKGERTINGYELTWTSTACYRGYLATWEMTDDSLYLVRLEKGCFNEASDYFDLSKEFGSNRVFAHWFTGKTIAPKGKLLHYVHDGYESIYEKELSLTFKSRITNR